MNENTTGPDTGTERVTGVDNTDAVAATKPQKPPTQTIGSIAELRARLASDAAVAASLLTAAEIIAVEDRQFRIVPVPEWDGAVVVRSLSGIERDAFEAGLVIVKGKTREMSTLNIRAKLCALTIVDVSKPDTITRAFSDEQIGALGAKSAAALSRVYDEAADLSGISEKDTEELEKNSQAAVSAAS